MMRPVQTLPPLFLLPLLLLPLACGAPSSPELDRFQVFADTAFQPRIVATADGAEIRGAFGGACEGYRLEPEVEVLSSTVTLVVTGQPPAGGCAESSARLGYRAWIHGLGDEVWDVELKHAWADGSRPDHRIVGRPVEAASGGATDGS